ncbi:MAG: hypothetical protein ACJ8AW_10465 [Rhodopila sp.]
MRCASLAESHPDIDAIASEADGRLSIVGISVFRLLALQGDAAKGDAVATRLFPAVMSAVREVNNPPPLRLPSCVICDQAIQMYRRYVIGVVHAAVETPDAALTFLLCNSCCSWKGPFDAAAEQIIRRHWPDAQVFGPSGQRVLTQSGRRPGGDRGGS